MCETAGKEEGGTKGTAKKGGYLLRKRLWHWERKRKGRKKASSAAKTDVTWMVQEKEGVDLSITKTGRES